MIMNEAKSIYYCWVCDAHRVAASSNQDTRNQDTSAKCPRCGAELPEAARIQRQANIVSRKAQATYLRAA